MARAPLSLLPPQDLVDELQSEGVLVDRTDEEKEQIIDAATQEVCDTYNNDERDDYLHNNLEDPLSPSIASAGFRTGFGIASVAGTDVVFSSPLDDDDYVLDLPVGVDYINPVGLVDTRTAAGFTAFAAEDGVGFGYIAAEPT